MPGSVAIVPPRHDRRSYPLPAGWNVTFSPDEPELGPGAEITVAATVNAPDGFRGNQAINIHAFNGPVLAGGVTLFVRGA
jgi:hypothetical protein